MTSSRIAWRELRHSLAAASDEQLVKIVNVLDKTADQALVHEALELVRPRLRQLGLARPLRWKRLLAIPLEGALVAPGRYRGDHAEIPRSAIAPISAAVMSSLGSMVDDIDTALQRPAGRDPALIAQLGPRLWDAAGRAQLVVPQRAWEDAGLPVKVGPAILLLCGALWRHGASLWIAQQQIDEANPRDIRKTLAVIAQDDASVLLAAARLLMRASTRPATIARMASELIPAIAPAAEQDVRQALLSGVEALRGAASIPRLEKEARDLARRLQDADAADQTIGRDTLRADLAPLRASSIALCCARIAAELNAAIINPLRTQLNASQDIDWEFLEEAARQLRNAEIAARPLGGDAALNRVLRSAVAELLRLGSGLDDASRIGVARIVEILDGREAAAQLINW